MHAFRNFFTAFAIFGLGVALSLNAAYATEFEHEFQRGLTAYKQKDYTLSAELMWKSILEGNQAASPWLYLANSYYGLGKPALAIKNYRVLRDTFKGTTEAGIAKKMLIQLDPTGKLNIEESIKKETASLKFSTERQVPLPEWGPKFHHN